MEFSKLSSIKTVPGQIFSGALNIMKQYSILLIMERFLISGQGKMWVLDFKKLFKNYEKQLNLHSLYSKPIHAIT